MAEFRINISNLSEGIHEYRFEAEPSKIGLDERFISTVKIETRIDKNVRQIFLQAEIRAEGSFFCDRCLENFHQEMNTAYSMVYVQGARSTVDLNKEEEIQILAADMNYIDLDDDVRQYILLTIPQKLLCKEDCQGFCPTCGVNKNIASCTCGAQEVDSRWDVLKKLSHN
ncbi:MAG: DUF177 domain-containing protein [Ignavibacteriales bacterium]|nr:DUF177 domain-containing protein [Ignavibacteriales bacterium]